ncbi:hypothetical protein [Salinibacterium sp. M195]|uniref:hypothetical protein n=1 Tax=Salinibacterium sp. M195 TaxID=2583374 RepID=UPI001C628E17|nr:hypothetical protein [Salinibacterium sp. M195]QYH34986.1 hypothetical protein FFT87_02925 [Salinibacterium sp. M195]
MSHPTTTNGSGVGIGVELGVADVGGVLVGVETAVVDPDGTQPESANNVTSADAAAKVIRARGRCATTELLSRPLSMPEE